MVLLFKNIKNDKKKLTQELIELERQWKAHHEIENEAKTHKILSTEKHLWHAICETVRLTENAYSNSFPQNPACTALPARAIIKMV